MSPDTFKSNVEIAGDENKSETTEMMATPDSSHKSWNLR